MCSQMESNVHCGDMSMPEWTMTPELQATVMTGVILLCAWFAVWWVLRLILSMLWPISVIVIAVVIFYPETARRVAQEVIPQYLETLREWAQLYLRGANITLPSQS
uniref:Uncharacterized protein n=1 Tax=Timema shepardi TaxID=629360 RepID=A0A7R9FWG5_TIMSH|nr:unnamed protein product [Timema shepardi]